MNPKDFSGSAPGRLVPTILGAQAFVPSEVPRTLNLDLTTVRRLSQADSEVGRLAGTTGRLINPYLVGSPLLHREAILSSRIEGTFTTPEELVLFEAGDPEPAGPSKTEDTKEVANYMAAMRHGLRRLDALPVCLRLIREIHGILMDGVRGEDKRPGEFRASQNFIGSARSAEAMSVRIAGARYVPPPVPEMTELLNDFEKAIGQRPEELPVLIHLAVVHYQFEAIHPFSDGNGRIGRLLIALLLCSYGLLSEPLLYLSAYLERHREEYNDRMLRVSQAGAWLDWIGFFLRGVEESAREATEQAEGLLKLRDRYHQQFQSARSSALLLKLIDELFRTPSITIKRAATVLGVTEAAASYNIGKLVDAKILVERTGRVRNQRFIAPEILTFIDRPARP